ncbi:MAG: T9SS type A sorting domain-containing protein, partial [Gemmatimonadetes bacterium]|nr:T9SS type A sorting domain-containing protein [Gemmatimonadota bacterium]
IYDTAIGAWAPWNDFDGFISFAGCEFWNVNAAEDLTPFLGTTIDSLQMGWEVLDISNPGDLEWGKHGAVQYVVDNVAFGSFDGSATVFTTRGIDIFADTFSRADPAHTPFLQNAEQGNWNGAGGSRAFANADSLEVAVTDSDGMTGQNVTIHWRVEEGFGSGFGAWASKSMDFAVQDPVRPAGEGTYRAIIGADDGGSEDFEGTSGNGLIWETGTTVEYYILAVDDGTNSAYFPNAADPVNPTPTFFEFSVLPFNLSTAGNIADGVDVNGAPTDSQGPAGTHFVLLVDDYTRNALDFENSTGFNPTGGIGQGAFTGASFDQPEDMVERALALLYGGSEETPHWDKYDVQGGGSSVQCEPRGTSDVANGLGAYMTDNLNPYYDAVIWLQGTFDQYSYADTTRLELAGYLDNGGCLFSTGDQVAFHLGDQGNDADSLIGFAVEYFGTSFTAASDESTVDRVLNVVGQGSMAGLELGLYGECPIRRTFDRLTLSAPVGATNSVLLTYEDSSDPLDNGRIAGIKNVRTVGGGTAAHLGFGIEGLLSDVSRARVLGAFLGTDCGLTVNAVAGNNNGVDAPVIANGFGFNLAAARPNPFRDATSIQFAVPSKQHVTIEVYNILGQKVRTLVDESMDANSYVRDWDGRSDAGAEVSSGIYFYKMVAGQFSATKKAVLLK